MLLIGALIGFPMLAAIGVLLAKKKESIAVIVRLGSIVTMATSIIVACVNYSQVVMLDLSGNHFIGYLTLFLEILMASYIIYKGIRSRKFLVVLFAAVHISIMTAFEFFFLEKNGHQLTLYIDRLTILMIIIVGIIGSLICVYGVEYMNDYHHHHPEVKDRRGMFFAVLFIFMSAMFGLVLCNDMVLMLFFWEITSLCSFLLIGYTKTEEAIRNSFKALTTNVGGGLCFAIGLILLGVYYGVTDMQSLLELDENSSMVTLIVLLLATAGLTKSAQMPFSQWLTGAMVAPTPTSAMLHSSTMVKAGVYLIIRLAPTLGANMAGYTIATIGGITFLMTALMAVAQSDAKKILAYSTISNLGLIVACAAIDTAESLWAAIMLIIFHAIAKSLLFLSVGSTEHQIGSRNVEDMDGLYKISKSLTMLLAVGIAGMFIAPFGMLISKWAAMKAFIDSGNILIVLLVVFGSTITLFFWTKWLGKLLANAHHTHYEDYTMRLDEKVSLFTLGFMVIIMCICHPIISNTIVIPYIDSNLHIDFVSPINSVDSTLIIMMLCILLMFTIILIPLYNRHKEQPSSVYLSGQNAGDNESFYGSMGTVVDVELRNWYLPEILNVNRLGGVSKVLCGGALLAGFCLSIGGILS